MTQEDEKEIWYFEDKMMEKTINFYYCLLEYESIQILGKS